MLCGLHDGSGGFASVLVFSCLGSAGFMHCERPVWLGIGFLFVSLEKLQEVPQFFHHYCQNSITILTQHSPMYLYCWPCGLRLMVSKVSSGSGCWTYA